MSEVTSTQTAAVIETIHAELVDGGVDPELITAQAKFDNLEIDSIDTEQLLSTIEKQYGVAIASAELSGLTVGELAAKVVALQV